MADDSQVIRGINWREALPFTHIFRAFRVAVHPSKLILGLIALLALYIGGRCLDGMWPATSLAVPGEIQHYEAAVSSGRSNDEFSLRRRDERDKVEQAYAQKLIALNIVTDSVIVTLRICTGSDGVSSSCPSAAIVASYSSWMEKSVPDDAW